MSHLNVEIKARFNRHDDIRAVLQGLNARYAGLDRQTDTYFNCGNGGLKLREGDIEHNLIHYDRSVKNGLKHSEVTLYAPQPDSGLKELLERALGVVVVVKKEREIYFVDNVKIHLDHVEPFGSFIEIEAIDKTGLLGEEILRAQCEEFMERFGISDTDLVNGSYSDMVSGEGD